MCSDTDGLFGMIWKLVPADDSIPVTVGTIVPDAEVELNLSTAFSGPVHGNSPQSLILAHHGFGSSRYATASFATLTNLVPVNVFTGT